MRPLCLVGKGTALSLRYEVYDAQCTDNNGIMWMGLVFHGRLWLWMVVYCSGRDGFGNSLVHL